MALDPMSALSLAAVVVQFVDFSSKIVSKGYHLYNANNGALPEHEQLRFMASDLRDLSQRLHDHEKLEGSTKEEKALEGMSTRCEQIGNDLLGKLAMLQVANDAKFRRWKSFRQALKTVCSKEELDGMSATLSEYRNQLEIHILLSLRERYDLLPVQQTKQFETVDARTKEIVLLLQKEESPFRDELEVQQVVIARFHQETQRHITLESRKTRAELARAIALLKNPGAPRDGQQEAYHDEAAKRRHIVEDSILSSLEFSTMTNRYHGIDDAHAKTFDWIFRSPEAQGAPWSDFSEWLLNGDGIYWINGKVGSGKSTLMRYIYRDARTQSLLKQWASPKDNLLTAAFFFWKSGNKDQASQTGLLRSLLFTLLEQRRDLIQAVFSKEWGSFERASHPYSEHSRPHWTIGQLTIALKTFFQLDIGARVCIFIDGLDEYDGDPTDTIQLFKSLRSSEVKMCLSSRPCVEYDDAFKNMPALRLQDLTLNDLTLYIDEMLATDERMIEFSKQFPAEASAFTTEILTKAQGVFLWVKLVVRSLLNGLMNGDQIEELKRRLTELPSDLKSLYSVMFAAIDTRYLEEGSKIFQMMYAMQNLEPSKAAHFEGFDLSAILLSFALDDDDKVFHIPMETLTATEVTQRVQKVDKRLKVCCAGLLELDLRYLNNDHYPDLDKSAAVESSRDVTFIHRSAKDFLDTIRDSLLQHTPKNFGPHTSLLRGSIMQLKKGSPLPESKAADFHWLLATPMALAQVAETEQHKPTTELIDEFANVLSYLRPKTGHCKQYTNLNKAWPDDFLIIAVRSSLFTYLARKFDLPNQIPRSHCGHSYLYYALRKESETGLIHSVEIIEFLLKYSSKEDIAEGWKTLLKLIYNVIREEEEEDDEDDEDARLLLATLRLFLENGADPKEQILTRDWTLAGAFDLYECVASEDDAA